MRNWTKFLTLLALTGLGFVAILYVWGLMLSPNLSDRPIEYPADQLDSARDLRDVSFDPENPPVVQVDVDYSEGSEAAWYPKGQAPILAELVEEGKLPPVADRVGPEPLVLEGPDGIGKYGGTWFRLANSFGDINLMGNRMSGAYLVRWSPMGYPIRPHIAKSWDVSPDQKEWTFFLRKGMKWSDGHPFTADDFVYRWEKETQLFYPDSAPPYMMIVGKPGTVIKVDDYTVKFVFPEPNGLFLEQMASFAPFAPRHYMEQYHPETGNQDLIKNTMKAQGITSARTLYSNLQSMRNPEYPRLWPWIYRTYKSSAPESYVRNPYYFAVDPAGNQLPYVDRVLFEVKSQMLIPISASSGDITLQERGIEYQHYTLLMENRERNKYEVYHWFPAARSLWTIWPNRNRRADPGDKIAEQKAALLNEKIFRQALSLAINRKEIISAIYSGYGEPSQIAPGVESPFHSEKLAKSFVEYNPALANQMLDELGLTQRDSEGMRTFPDGSRMTWYMDFTQFTGEGPAQFVVDDWGKAGIRAVQRERSRPLFSSEQQALLHDFTIWSGESEFNPMAETRSFVPVDAHSHQAPAYGKWYQKGGMTGNPQAWEGGIEPPVGSPDRRVMELLEEAKKSSEQAGQVRIFQQIADINAEEVWSISIATPPPQLTVVKDGFRNVPRNVIYGYVYSTPSNGGIETFFFDNPSDSPGAVAQMKNEMIKITPAPDAVDPATMSVSGDGWMGRLIWNLIIGIGALLVVLAGVRHPFIGRRLVIMIPTLVIISVITFIIIQLPPGDFIETRILQLQQTGDEAAIEDVERLREAFHLDESGWQQYIRWLGLRWFLGFDSADKGLLQGHMGRSMETQRSVNAMVGDRVMLTFLVSLGTILFTWIIAFPIGIYSAVRQYSPGDYILSFLGFIGMCVPNFLLAIIMMYWSSRYLGINVTGLFSPEYAAAPEWSMGKVIDLLQHMWVPVIVIALAGTAGMIRVMRGNLLDELRKPYVTTAMAKGVRPFKLLMKYPVRLALNPFISGIGGIFPQLVSGGAIVAIVLSLPMVGPLLLDGLMTQDVYLAASMLMVLSLLGVFGTLVSDLLLLWIDPRIRMEGGGR